MMTTQLWLNKEVYCERVVYNYKLHTHSTLTTSAAAGYIDAYAVAFIHFCFTSLTTMTAGAAHYCTSAERCSNLY